MTLLSYPRYWTWIVLGLVLLLAATLLSAAPAGSAPAATSEAAGTPQAVPLAPTPRFDWPWAAGFFQPGTNGIINAAVLASNGDLYVGGSFAAIGDVAANNIARWDGTHWHALGSGTNNAVSALAIAPDGTLYAGGSFTEAGDCATDCNRIAAWDGSAWSALGTGIDSLPNKGVRALAIAPDGTLYAGGEFAAAGACASDCTNIARWNGTAWNSLETGIATGAVLTMATDSTGKLYVGGSFPLIGSPGCAATPCTGIAAWSGTAWSGLETGVNGTVNTIAIDASNTVYAGGTFLTASSCAVGCEMLARWNGSAWSSTGLVTSALLVYALDFAPNGTLYVAGGIVPGAGGLFASMSGATWTDMSSDGPAGQVNVLQADAAGNLYAGGAFLGAGTCMNTCNAIARLSGTTWSPLGQAGAGPAGSSITTAAAPDGDIYVGGWFASAGTCTNGCKNIARWDGARWHPLGAGLSHIVDALAVADDGTVYAAGIGQVSKWDGTAWSELESPNPTARINAMAVDHNGTLYIGGVFIVLGCIECQNIARWDTNAWAPLDIGIGQPVHALAVDSENTLYAGGDFQSIDGMVTSCGSCQYIGMWKGTGWSGLASNPNGRVRALLLDGDDKLYAGGDFTSAGSCITNCKRIAHWSGTAWSGLGTGANQPVYSLAHDGEGVIYAGGNFTSMGTCTSGCSHIAGWDGAAWFALDDGTNGIVHKIAIDELGAVHAVGWFDLAGGKPSYQFAAQSINRVALPLVLR